MMKQDFKNVAYMSVFVLIVGAGFGSVAIVRG